MATITITIPDDRLLKLEELADRFGVSADELLRANLDDLLRRSDEEFRQALEHVLEKNAQLYRRLA